MKKILLIGLGTLLFFGIAGIYVIERFQQVSFVSILRDGWNVPMQILVGTIYGSLSAFLALFIISRSFFKEKKKYYYQKISGLKLNYGTIIFLSFCAGIGEEIFFRGGIQPLLGIWPTSILFVLLHGYLNPFNWRISIYGIFMVIVIAGFGYLFETIGIITAIIAHTIFDFILFREIVKEKNQMG
jgi:uncharacterized protein